MIVRTHTDSVNNGIGCDDSCLVIFVCDSYTILGDELRDSATFVRAVGDCVRARKVSPAIYEAYYAAVDLA